jgi:hypothetical protein
LVFTDQILANKNASFYSTIEKYSVPQHKAAAQ